MPLMTNGKRDYKKEYAAILLRRKNNEEYDAKYKKDASARSVRSWHKNKTPEKLAAKRLYIKEYTLKYPERRKLTAKKTYEKISSQLNKDIFLCPADYPYLYSKLENSNIYIGNMRHWRSVNETLITFLTSKKMILKYLNELKSMATIRHHPMEKKLHEIYEKEICLSPIPSLSMHCTNINSIYGIPPSFDWKKVWEENEV